MSDNAASDESDQQGDKRRPGRPPTYVFTKPDCELSENELRLKGSVFKRRLRQNRSYHRKKRLKELAQQSSNTALGAASPAVSSNPDLLTAVSRDESPTATRDDVGKSTSELMMGAIMQSDAVSARQGPSGIDNHSSGSQEHMKTLVGTYSAGFAAASGAASSCVFEEAMLSSVPASALCLGRSASQTPTSSVDVHVQNSGRVSLLCPGAISGSLPGEKRDALGCIDDENRLLQEILGIADVSPLDHRAGCEVPSETGLSLARDVVMRQVSIPERFVKGFNHLYLFPGTFAAESACYLMDPSFNSAVEDARAALQPFIDAKLLGCLPTGRYEVRQTAKNSMSAMSPEEAGEGRRRFVHHFAGMLRDLESSSLWSDGAQRTRAMRIFDVERENMDVAIQLCEGVGGKKLLVNFLASGATVIRYLTTAYTRVRIFQVALDNHGSSFATAESNRADEARVTLALAEASFDTMSFEDGDKYLRKAIGMMAVIGEGLLPMTTSVLALLLLAESRIRERKFEESKKLLAQALMSLRDGGMQKSTYAVCCLLNFASVHMLLGDYGDALCATNSSLSLLSEMGCAHMPIYADALGSLGAVCFLSGDLEQSRSRFFASLAIIRDWMTRQNWSNVPSQHCSHLDISLVENLAETYVAQERYNESAKLLKKAENQRLHRKLPPYKSDGAAMSGFGSGKFFRVNTRHLY